MAHIHCLALISLMLLPQSVLKNPGFRDGLSGWQVSSERLQAEAVEIDGQTAVHMVYEAPNPIGWPAISQSLEAAGGELYSLSFKGKAAWSDSGAGFYGSAEFLDAEGRRISYAQSEFIAPDGEWHDCHMRFYLPGATVKMNINLMINGYGEGWYSGVNLEQLETPSAARPDGPVTLTIGERPVCESLIGFGAEDDGWRYAPCNTDRGLTEEDFALCEARIRWMDPDWQRMFFWLDDWLDKEAFESPDAPLSFNWDTPNMRSKYRTLDLYQSIGAAVNLVNVEWGWHQPYDRQERIVQALGELMEHLIEDRGYTCIRYWTLTNEPNISMAVTGDTFARYRAIHKAMAGEFARRGLDIKIIGSDDAQSMNWFSQCVEDPEYYGTVDVFASHRYFNAQDIPLTPFFFSDRLSRLETKSPIKPLIAAEFGFQDAQSTHLLNPVMDTYHYAIWAAQFILNGLNRGTAGFSIWTMHEVEYPVGTMNYGLWHYKDRDWAVRPVYHAMAMFTRLTEAGMRVWPCESSHPLYASGAVVGDTLFWVNPSAEDLEIHFEGRTLGPVRVMTESTLEGDRETGRTVTPNPANGFHAPAMSFGFADLTKTAAGDNDYP